MIPAEGPASELAVDDEAPIDTLDVALPLPVLEALDVPADDEGCDPELLALERAVVEPVTLEPLALPASVELPLVDASEEEAP